MLGSSQIRTVLLAGSGVMGISFAQIFARNGYEVILYDIVRGNLQDPAPLLVEEKGAALIPETVRHRVQTPGSGADGCLRHRVQLMDPGGISPHLGKNSLRRILYLPTRTTGHCR